jgi:allantoinase
MIDLAIHSKRVLIAGRLTEATVFVKDGIIADVVEGAMRLDIGVENLGNLVVMPGLIDSHVHINEPGRTEWEGFETITQAAVAGGITTLVDMPLNSSPVTVTVQAFAEKLKAAEGKLFCNCGFWGGMVPGNTDELEGMLNAGVFGIKAFLTHSGIPDFPNVTEEDLRKGMAVMARYQAPLLLHAELDEVHAGGAAFEKNQRSYQAFLNSRPKSWEDKAVALAIEICRTFNSPVHIVHLSSADSLEQIKAARADGLPLTVETCPHYLYFAAEDIPDGNTLYKCTPPIRERANRELLWKGLKDGLIDFVVSDHSPAPADLKKTDSGNLLEAWGGIAGVQFSLAAFWTGAKKRGFGLAEVSDLMSRNVAKFIGLGDRKGELKKGYDADIMVWDPDQQFVVSAADIKYRHKISPYTGETLCGEIRQTYVGGKKVFERGSLFGAPCGKILLRN